MQRRQEADRRGRRRPPSSPSARTSTINPGSAGKGTENQDSDEANSLDHFGGIVVTPVLDVGLVENWWWGEKRKGKNPSGRRAG